MEQQNTSHNQNEAGVIALTPQERDSVILKIVLIFLVGLLIFSSMFNQIGIRSLFMSLVGTYIVLDYWQKRVVKREAQDTHSKK